jgi:hypothetical protein
MKNEIEIAYERWNNCEGMKFIWRRNVYRVSHNIFEGNATELENSLLVLESPKSLTRFNLAERVEKDSQLIYELNRLFHNFLASAKTMIDHTRVFINDHYEDSSIQLEYQSEIDKKFKNDELCRFIQDLRNYILHRGIPDSHLKAELHQEREEVTCAINLDVVKLLEWNRWTSPSRIFLLQREKDKVMSLSSIVTPYANKITELYAWFDSLLNEYHSKDMIEYEKLRNDFENMKSQK